MEVSMKDDIWFWLEQVLATVLFCGLCVMLYVVMVLVFPDPLLWK